MLFIYTEVEWGIFLLDKICFSVFIFTRLLLRLKEEQFSYLLFCLFSPSMYL